MSDPLRGLGPLSKTFVIASAVLLTLVLVLGLYAAFFLDGPISTVPRAILVLAGVAAFVWLQMRLSKAVKEANEHSRSMVGRTQKAIDDSRKAKERD